MLAIRTAIGGHIGAITYCYFVRWKAPVFVIIRFPINRSQACKNSLMKNLSVHHNYSGDVAGISRMVRLSTCLSASESLFYRAMLCIRGTSHGPVSVRLSQVGVLSKRLDESGSFLVWELLSTYPTLC